MFLFRAFSVLFILRNFRITSIKNENFSKNKKNVSEIEKRDKKDRKWATERGSSYELLFTLFWKHCLITPVYQQFRYLIVFPRDYKGEMTVLAVKMMSLPRTIVKNVWKSVKSYLKFQRKQNFQRSNKNNNILKTPPPILRSPN